MELSVAEFLLWGCVFLLGVSAIEHYTRDLFLPPVCWILLAGVLYGILRGHAGLALPALQPSPEVVLFLFFPVLIFNSSRELGVRELAGVWPEAGFLALADHRSTYPPRIARWLTNALEVVDGAALYSRTPGQTVEFRMGEAFYRNRYRPCGERDRRLQSGCSARLAVFVPLRRRPNGM